MSAPRKKKVKFMKKYVSYIVLGFVVIICIVFTVGFFYCCSYIPYGFEPDDLQLACFGVGFFAIPFWVTSGYLLYRIAELWNSAFRKKKTE